MKRKVEPFCVSLLFVREFLKHHNNCQCKIPKFDMMEQQKKARKRLNTAVAACFYCEVEFYRFCNAVSQVACPKRALVCVARIALAYFGPAHS
jgi:hypothetical protein